MRRYPRYPRRPHHHRHTHSPHSAQLATGIGSVTATGSVVAYGKLNGSLDSGAMNLAGRDQVPCSTTDPSSTAALCFTYG